jgi:hypothetical protein
MLFGRSATAIIATSSKEYTKNDAKECNGKCLDRFHISLVFFVANDGFEYNNPIREKTGGQHAQNTRQKLPGKKQDVAVKVLADYAKRVGGARGLEKWKCGLALQM